LLPAAVQQQRQQRQKQRTQMQMQMELCAALFAEDATLLVQLLKLVETAPQILKPRSAVLALLLLLR